MFCGAVKFLELNYIKLSHLAFMDAIRTAQIQSRVGAALLSAEPCQTIESAQL